MHKLLLCRVLFQICFLLNVTNIKEKLLLYRFRVLSADSLAIQ